MKNIALYYGATNQLDAMSMDSSLHTSADERQPKLPGANFLAAKKFDRRPPIDVRWAGGTAAGHSAPEHTGDPCRS